jgi:hypothetical protein
MPRVSARPSAPTPSSPVRGPLRRTLAGLALAALGAGDAGCSSAATGCTVAFSGDVTESGSVAPGCGALTHDVDGGAPGSYTLELTASSASVATLQVSLDLGPAPAAGVVSSDTVTSWSALGLGSGNGNCGYTAGNEAVPTGSFTLTLTDVSGAPASRTAHGSLDMTLYVHAPPATDCGPGPTEDVRFTF